MQLALGQSKTTRNWISIIHTNVKIDIDTHMPAFDRNQGEWVINVILTKK